MTETITGVDPQESASSEVLAPEVAVGETSVTSDQHLRQGAQNLRDERPHLSWEAPALVVLLVGTACLYLWRLNISGWANAFYSAAAQAGSASWKALFFGSSDAANSITVDKPPASLWVMGISVKLFGLSSWSILIPQAMMGVSSVFLIFKLVRRWFSAQAAFLAGATLALTPVATLMFRYNNPDALLTLLILGATYTTLRGIEDENRKWVIATGTLVGFAFLTKQLQALLIVPPLGLTHLIAARPRFWRRVSDLLLAGLALVVSAGWWVAAVELWPKNSRPYIGGSQSNSILELTFGYNGLGRLTGNEVGSVTGGRTPQPGTGVWGQTGITRMFNGISGTQIAWMIPLALCSLMAGLWFTRRLPRTSLERAMIIALGSWLISTALVFSFMQGIYHDYYTVVLAPPIAGLVGIGGHYFWTRRSSHWIRALGAFSFLCSAAWIVHLSSRAGSWFGWVRPAVVATALVGAVVGLVYGATHRRLGAAAAIGLATAGLVMPAIWSIDTANTAHSGGIVTAGPAVVVGRFGGFPGRGPSGSNSASRQGFPGQNGQPPAGFPSGGGFRGPGQTGSGSQAPKSGTITNGPGGFIGGGFGPGAGQPGGLLHAAKPTQAVIDALLEGSDSFTWVAAAVGANEAAGYQLATQKPVMSIGGFNGSDPSPTLEQFKEYVVAGKIHYFVGGRGFGPPNGGSRDSSEIAAYATSNFTPVTIGNFTLYDLTKPLATAN